MSPHSQDGPVRAPTRATETLASEQEAPVAEQQQQQQQQQQQVSPVVAPAAAATATAMSAPPAALIPVAAFRSNPAGIPAPADAKARSARAVTHVIGALPRVNTGPPNRRSTLLRLVGGLTGIEGALDVEEERAVRAATLLVTARVDNLSRQSDVLAEVVLTADGTETTEDGQPIACAELQALLRTKTVPGAMTAAFYMIALCMAWRVCLQVRPSITAELAAGFFYLSDLRDLARRAFGFRLRIERSGQITPVDKRVYAKKDVDFFALVDKARAKGVERRGNAKDRKYRLCAHFYPQLRAEALRLAASGATTLVLAEGASAAGGASSSSSGSRAASGSGSRAGLPALPQPAAEDADEGGEVVAADEPVPPMAAQLLGNLELPPSGSFRLNDREMVELLDHLALDDDDDNDGNVAARKRLPPNGGNEDEPDGGPAQRRQRAGAAGDDDDDDGRDWGGDGCDGGDDDTPAGTAAVSRGGLLDAQADARVTVTTRTALAQAPKTKSAARPRVAAPRATPAAVAAARAVAAAALAVPAAAALGPVPAALSSSNTAAVVKHLSGEDLRELEGWAAPLALDGAASPLLGARVSPAGRVELVAPSASLSRLRVGLSAAGRLLLDVGGRGAWLANQKQVGGSPLFALGLGEVFSTVARLEHHHHALAPRAEEEDDADDEASATRLATTAAATASLGRTIADDCVTGGRVLVLWLDPARLIGQRGEAGGPMPSVVEPAPFELTLAGGGGPVALEHGAVLVAAGPTRADDAGGHLPSYAVRASSSVPSPSSRRAPGDPPALVELRFYTSAAVARRCVLVDDAGVRQEVAESVRAL